MVVTGEQSHYCLSRLQSIQSKGNSPLPEFLAKQPERVRQILTEAKAPLGDAAAVNSTRWALWRQLEASLPDN